jgi:uncharacterized membrane protein
MPPVLAVAGWWVLFAGSHVLLAAGPVRGPLVRRFGERGFVTFFTVVASILFAGLVHAYAGVRFSGPPGLGLAAVPAARGVLIAAIALGFALMIGAFAPRGYWTSPMMIFATGSREPTGLERVTRHPFFAGVVLFALAHALLATQLVGTVFFAGFGVLAIAGAAHQGRKLLRSRPGYDRYLQATSAVPFAAIVAGRQRFVPGEIPWVFLALGVGVAWLLRQVHGSIWDFGGAWVSGTAIAGSALIGIRGFASAARTRPA